MSLLHECQGLGARRMTRQSVPFATDSAHWPEALVSKHGYARDDHIKVRAPATTGNVDTCRMFSFEFINDVDYDTTVERILADQPNDGLLPLVVTPNVDDVLQLRQPENA